MNLYQIYDAAFDSTNSEYIQNTREYISDYADNVMDICLKKWQIDEILKARMEWLDAEKDGSADADTFWHTVVVKLEGIEV